MPSSYASNPRDHVPPTSSTASHPDDKLHLSRLEERVSHHTAVLDCYRQHMEQVEATVARLSHEFSHLTKAVRDLRAKPDLPPRPHHPAPASLDVDILAAQMRSVTTKANEVDELRIQLELIKDRLRRLEEPLPPTPRDTDFDQSPAASRPPLPSTRLPPIRAPTAITRSMDAPRSASAHYHTPADRDSCARAPSRSSARSDDRVPPSQSIVSGWRSAEQPHTEQNLSRPRGIPAPYTRELERSASAWASINRDRSGKRISPTDLPEGASPKRVKITSTADSLHGEDESGGGGGSTINHRAAPAAPRHFPSDVSQSGAAPSRRTEPWRFDTDPHAADWGRIHREYSSRPAWQQSHGPRIPSLSYPTATDRHHHPRDDRSHALHPRSTSNAATPAREPSAGSGTTPDTSAAAPSASTSATKKSRSKPTRNADGVLIRKDGRPDMRSISSANNLRKVHARRGIGGSAAGASADAAAPSPTVPRAGSPGSASSPPSGPAAPVAAANGLARSHSPSDDDAAAEPDTPDPLRPPTAPDEDAEMTDVSPNSPSIDSKMASLDGHGRGHSHGSRQGDSDSAAAAAASPPDADADAQPTPATDDDDDDGDGDDGAPRDDDDDDEKESTPEARDRDRDREDGA